MGEEENKIPSKGKYCNLWGRRDRLVSWFVAEVKSNKRFAVREETKLEL